jgi:hypothetical protein
VWLGFCVIDTDCRANTRLEATALDITKAGFTLEIKCWSDSHAWNVGVAWVATCSSDICAGECRMEQACAREDGITLAQAVNPCCRESVRR